MWKQSDGEKAKHNAVHNFGKWLNHAGLSGVVVDTVMKL